MLRMPQSMKTFTMGKIEETYLAIILEDGFKKSKWTYVHEYRGVKQYVNEEHLSESIRAL